MKVITELEYYENTRDDIRPLLAGRTFARSLDIGCGAGAVSAALKKSGIVAEAEGVEVFPAAAARAAQRLRRVYSVDLAQTTGDLPLSSYDLVLCLDVLEHMVDPWSALERIKGLMKSDGTLLVSLPNVRNFRVVVPLLMGKWTYRESGLLDQTHLRFFTRSSARELIEGAGFRVRSFGSTSRRRYSRSWWIDVLTLGLFRDFLEFQYVIEATPRT